MAKSTGAKSPGDNYRKTTLKNGVRVISERLPSVRSLAIGVWVDVGSRHEQTGEDGLSHFIEHMVFKGTRRRNAKQVAASLESIGGSLNAFTTREQTCFTARVLDEHFNEAMDVLADITCHATFTPTNMDRERLVICEEIKESLDNPSDRIHDLFARTFWGDHPLGQPIMGQPETIRTVSRATVKKFLKRHYRTESIVVAAAGAVSHQRLVRTVREKFNFEPGEGADALEATRINHRQVAISPDKNSQTHFCLGFPAIAYNDPRKMTMLAMATYLGGGMSSVLFQKLREQRGLAYSVFAYHDFHRDAGVFGIYLGTDGERLREAYDLIITECRRLKKKRLSTLAITQAKAQLKGHLMLSMESTSNRMHRLGRQEMMAGNYLDSDTVLKQIDKVTAADVIALTNEVFDESQMSLAAQGPISKNIFDNAL